MHLRLLSQKTILDFLNSLGESDLKLSVADEGSFVCWLGQGDRYGAFSLIVVSYNIIGLRNFASMDEECPCLKGL